MKQFDKTKSWKTLTTGLGRNRQQDGVGAEAQSKTMRRKPELAQRRAASRDIEEDQSGWKGKTMSVFYFNHFHI